MNSNETKTNVSTVRSTAHQVDESFDRWYAGQRHQLSNERVCRLIWRRAWGECANQLEAEVASLRAALHWYADGRHFDKGDPCAWDTVSGEPQNWWCDEAGTAMVEDGSLAGMVLAGKITGQKL